MAWRLDWSHGGWTGAMAWRLTDIAAGLWSHGMAAGLEPWHGG
jgi:hypothetical protein